MCDNIYKQQFYTNLTKFIITKFLLSPILIHTPPSFLLIHQRVFQQTKPCATASDSPNESNEDDTKACLGFLVYLFCEQDQCEREQGSDSNAEEVGSPHSSQDFDTVMPSAYLDSIVKFLATTSQVKLMYTYIDSSNHFHVIP